MPILKGSHNRQKTVLPLPVWFETMDINQKHPRGRPQADDRIKGD